MSVNNVSDATHHSDCYQKNQPTEGQPDLQLLREWILERQEEYEQRKDYNEAGCDGERGGGF